MHFFLTFLIYIHIYKTYIKHKNIIYRFYKKKLHKVHTMKILAIYECFLLEIACILTAHQVHTLHTIDDMGLILSVTSCVTAEWYAGWRHLCRSCLYPLPRASAGGLVQGCIVRPLDLWPGVSLAVGQDRPKSEPRCGPWLAQVWAILWATSCPAVDIIVLFFVALSATWAPRRGGVRGVPAMPGAAKLRHPLLCPFLFSLAELSPYRANGAYAAVALGSTRWPVTWK